MCITGRNIKIINTGTEDIIIESTINEKKIIISEGVKVIEKDTFKNNTKLEEIVFPDSLEVIEEGAFRGTSLKCVKFNPGLKRIEAHAFSQCSRLETIIFNDGLEYIGEKAFKDCPCRSVLIPHSVRAIGDDSFNIIANRYGCYDMEFRIDTGNPYLLEDGHALYRITDSGLMLQKAYDNSFQGNAFNFDRSRISYSVLENTVEIGRSAFECCRNLETVFLPDGLKTISDGAFEECHGLRKIVFPDTLEVIGENAFFATSVEKFKLSKSVREIGPGAFSVENAPWNSLIRKRTIKVDRNNKDFFVENNMLFRQLKNGDIELLSCFSSDEIAAVPSGVTAIRKRAFFKSRVDEVRLPCTIKRIEEEAFGYTINISRFVLEVKNEDGSMSYAKICFPADKKKPTYYLNCLKDDDSGEPFDFDKYDSLFNENTNMTDKVILAINRLDSPVKLNDCYKKQYQDFLEENAQQIINMFLSIDDLSGIFVLAELGAITEKNIDALIDDAGRKDNIELLTFLMNFKNDKIGNSFDDLAL